MYFITTYSNSFIFTTLTFLSSGLLTILFTTISSIATLRGSYKVNILVVFKIFTSLVIVVVYKVYNIVKIVNIFIASINFLKSLPAIS